MSEAQRSPEGPSSVDPIPVHPALPGGQSASRGRFSFVLQGPAEEMPWGEQIHDEAEDDGLKESEEEGGQKEIQEEGGTSDVQGGEAHDEQDAEAEEAARLARREEYDRRKKESKRERQEGLRQARMDRGRATR